MRSITCFWENETGQSVVQYGLILALAAFALEIGLTAVGGGMAAALVSAGERRTF